MDGRALARTLGASISRRTAIRHIAVGAAALAAMAAQPTRAFAGQGGRDRDVRGASTDRLSCAIWCTPVDCCPGGCCNPPTYPYLARCEATNCGYYYYTCMNVCTSWCDSPTNC